MMFDLNKEWSISFAGCGFMGIYYMGASSCFLERFPRFIHDACKIYGSSSGALMAASLTTGTPLEKCCADLMSMARGARKHRLGPLHPAFNLLQMVRDSLRRSLPEDAHVRASGRLCVSLTRVPDGKNVLVSEFDSREELVQALVCSCFIPFYCGVIPPTFRGVHYVDGAVSDNLPLCHLKNTVTFSAFAGESDVCPASTPNLHEVRFNNVSIQVCSENLSRVACTFFPPEPEVMSQICQSGYIDALCFLQENNLISSERPLRSLETDSHRPACCERVEERGDAEDLHEKTRQGGHFWLDPQVIDKLPVNIQRVLCEACRQSHSAEGLLSHMVEYLPKKVTSYLQMPHSLAHRLVDWIPEVPRDMSWLYGVAGDIYKQAWKDRDEDNDRHTIDPALRRCTSLPSDLNRWLNREEDASPLPMSPEATPTSSLTFTWNAHAQAQHLPLTPPPTPSFDAAPAESPNGAGRRWALGRAVGWIRNIAVGQISKYK